MLEILMDPKFKINFFWWAVSSHPPAPIIEKIFYRMNGQHLFFSTDNSD